MVLKFKGYTNLEIVEAAHMELAEPSILSAYRRCVEQGATKIIVYPYFLSRGKHVLQDIPELLKQAKMEFRDVDYNITNPLGFDEGILDIMKSSVERVLLESDSC
jgi:sirohydrochlorin ferrochelatase